MDTIGLVSDAITIVTFFGDLIPKTDPNKGTEVIIKAGLGSINSDEDDHVSLVTVTLPRTIAQPTANDYRVAK
jgi:hypothetical protein